MQWILQGWPRERKRGMRCHRSRGRLLHPHHRDYFPGADAPGTPPAHPPATNGKDGHGKHASGPVRRTGLLHVKRRRGGLCNQGEAPGRYPSLCPHFTLNLFIPLRGLEGVAILLMIPVTLGCAKFLYNRGIIKVTPKEDNIKLVD
jgi:hypothetical protein